MDRDRDHDRNRDRSKGRDRIMKGTGTETESGNWRGTGSGGMVMMGNTSILIEIMKKSAIIEKLVLIEGVVGVEAGACKLVLHTLILVLVHVKMEARIRQMHLAN
ncbi:hypothetical protein HS088_TW13G00739 [Tripterygium wilfordii]|uniref:Uncharacterized protein n=1 Tax=Tripterygium wilfordii TaxID=458696 RepID=A0A7J7CV23_TRIWF|nr:hypothetical protein HS088_TW13G00739 [Tripterygium wilfordii]